MSQVFQNRNRIDIGRIPRGSFKSANAAFAKHNTVVSPGQNIFSGHEQFFDGGGESALE